MKKCIGFVTGGLKFNGNSLNEKSLGGSESAVIYMARELAKLGHMVFVYCDCDKPGMYDGVLYLSLVEFDKICAKTFDVLIVSRNIEVLHPETISNLTIFWMHDVYQPFFNKCAYLADKIFLLSEYQKSLWVEANKFYEPMIHVTTNGFDSELAASIPKRSFADRKNNYIFASRPERGLKILLEKVWPKILEMNPQAQLILCGYEVKQDNLILPEGRKEYYEDCDKLVEISKNIVKVGALTKEMFYHALSQCAYMVYPTDWPETSCINAIEAQALGCLVITSNYSALAETVKTDTKIGGVYGSDEYINEICYVLAQYQVESTWTNATEEARAKVFEQYPWSSVAKSWDEKFDQMFVERFEKYKPQVFRALSYYSDNLTRSVVDPDFDMTVLDGNVRMNSVDFDIHYDELLSKEGIDTATFIQAYPRQDAMKSFVADYMRKTPGRKFTVLELGCFDGQIVGNLYKENPNSIDKIIGYDIRQEPLDSLKAVYSRNPQCKNIEIICDDVTNLDKHKLEADVIIVGEILEHIHDYVEFLRKVHACATPGALILFSTPCGPWEDQPMRDFHRTFHDDQHCHHFELLDLFTVFADHTKENGFFINAMSGTKNRRKDFLSNYIYGYYKNNPDTSFYEYDPWLKATKMRPYFSISTCMIVKNEENNLYRCLNSVKHISDEIIIVDTGSNDRSKEICAQFTDKIYDLKWEEEDGFGSFERARNYSLDQANGDYIFYIDADEELINGWEFGSYVKSEYVRSVNMLQRQLSETTKYDTDQYPNRLFRRSDFRFIGVIHELPRQSPDRQNDCFQLAIPNETCRLIHYGYLHQSLNDEKTLRNHVLLHKNMAKYPDMVDNWMYHIRDMIPLFLMQEDPKFLYNGVDIWKNYPDKYESFTEVQFWMDSFWCMQFILDILVTKYGYENYIQHKINGKTFRFTCEKEIKILRKLLKKDKKEGGIFSKNLMMTVINNK